jgi:hypothetical protein
MEVGDIRRLRLVGYDRAGDEVEFHVRLVTLDEGCWAGTAPGDLLDMVARDSRVRLEDGTTGTAQVLSSGRTYAEVHGRLRRSRRLPTREPAGPVLLITADQANSA